MSLFHLWVLFFSGILAGSLNALAGGGGFITLPSLMFTGVSPLIANSTGTIAVLPGIMASMFAYRKNLKAHNHPLWTYLALVLSGAACGAMLLLKSSNAFFMGVLPFLLLFATLLFIFGKAINSRVQKIRGEDRPFPNGLLYLMLFLIAIYGGYFGGGMGIVILAILNLFGMEDIHEMNALKVFLTMSINAMCIVIFSLGDKIAWNKCLIMMSGCILGGYLGGRLVLKINPTKVRNLISYLAAIMTAYFFYHVYA